MGPRPPCSGIPWGAELRVHPTPVVLAAQHKADLDSPPRLTLWSNRPQRGISNRGVNHGMCLCAIRQGQVRLVQRSRNAQNPNSTAQLPVGQLFLTDQHAGLAESTSSHFVCLSLPPLAGHGVMRL
jgi:hypothetical protein